MSIIQISKPKAQIALPLNWMKIFILKGLFGKYTLRVGFFLWVQYSSDGHFDFTSDGSGRSVSMFIYSDSNFNNNIPQMDIFTTGANITLVAGPQPSQASIFKRALHVRVATPSSDWNRVQRDGPAHGGYGSIKFLPQAPFASCLQSKFFTQTGPVLWSWDVWGVFILKEIRGTLTKYELLWDIKFFSETSTDLTLIWASLGHQIFFFKPCCRPILNFPCNFWNNECEGEHVIFVVEIVLHDSSYPSISKVALEIKSMLQIWGLSGQSSKRD